MKKTKRVILFGIDGAGTFFEQTPTPNIDRLAARGTVCSRTVTEIPSISAQCWGSMLHGVECGWHGLTNAIAGERPYPADSIYPSVFRVIREAMPGAKLASFCDWDSINIGIIEDGLGVYKYHAPDWALVEPAVRYIEENDFTLMFFHFDSVDGAGHRHGYGTPEHLAAITKNDAYIGQILEAVERRGWLEETLVLVEADHGGTPNYGYGGQHGGATDAEKYVCFYAAGGSVGHGALENMMVRDTPAIILHALGIPQPESWTARVPGGIFAELLGEMPRPAGIAPAGLTLHREPLPEAGNFLNAFDCLEPMVYLSFEDASPEVTVHGKLYRVDGVMGSGMGFEDGFLTMDCPDMKPGYSVLFWVKPDRWAGHDTCIVAAAGAACQQVDLEPGMSIEVARDYVRLCQKGPIGDMPVMLDMTVPANAQDKWLHVAVTMDAEKGRFGISVDFGEFSWWDIPQGMALTEGGILYIGQDALELDAKRLRGRLDDFCICRKGLDAGDLIAMKAYYQL